MCKERREKMELYLNKRDTFRGTFKKMGYKNIFKGTPLPTLLLMNITDCNNNIIADHMWFNYTKLFGNLGELNSGDIIQFNARGITYTKGYLGDNDELKELHPIKEDYRLVYPTKIKLISRSSYDRRNK